MSLQWEAVISLFKKIINYTGLPQDLISKELSTQIQKKGLSEDNLSLEELRNVLSEYLQDVLLEAKKDLEAK